MFVLSVLSIAAAAAATVIVIVSLRRITGMLAQWFFQFGPLVMTFLFGHYSL